MMISPGVALPYQAIFFFRDVGRKPDYHVHRGTPLPPRRPRLLELEDVRALGSVQKPSEDTEVVGGASVHHLAVFQLCINCARTRLQMLFSPSSSFPPHGSLGVHA